MAARVRAMAETIRHRGPDGDGAWYDPAAGIALGHRRLAIIDLSDAGAQPMVSADGRYVVTYNGEIYNFEALAKELEQTGHRFRGRSDTEVLVEACAAWGVERTVGKLIGMFAFALWDRQERRLVLARDRLGIKPLYWGRFGGLFLFGSELKALRAHPGWTAEIDRDALAAYFRFAYVPEPLGIYAGIQKLPPGTLLTVADGGEPEIVRYWDPRAVARDGASDPSRLTDNEAADALDTLLRDAVGRRMVADVPLGAFLSGGIDSSAVAALMQAQSTRRVRTFTIGFNEPGYDEAKHAKAVAAHLGTDHTELYIDPGDALDLVSRLPDWFDEPFADSSQMPTYLVSEMTRRHVTVALSGDGGDEMFAGYNRYAWGERIWRRLGWMPRPMRTGLAGLMTAPPPAAWDRLFRMAPARLRPPEAGDKLYKFADALAAAGPDDLYRRMVTQWGDPGGLVDGAVEPRGEIRDETVARDLPGFVRRAQYFDSVTYLPGDILTKVDRTSMAVGLEARVPLLDHRVAEFAWRLPQNQTIRDGRGKWLLRRVLDRYVPRALIDRPKSGFAVPLAAWLRGPLRDWASDLLDEDRLRRDGVLNPTPIRAAWEEHLSGRRNRQHQIWTVLMFQAWRERWL